MRAAASALRMGTVDISLAETASSLAPVLEAPSLSEGFTVLFSRHLSKGGVDP